MKRKLALLTTIFLTIYFSQAQEFSVGTNAINVGLGIGGDFGSFTTSSVSPSINASYELGVWDIGGPGVISLGGYLGIKTYRYENSGFDAKWNYTILGVRAAYHYNGLNVENLDVYAGAMLTYNIANLSGDVAFKVESAVKPSIYVGGRWYFSDTFGVFAEVGYGVAYLTLGGTIRF